MPSPNKATIANLVQTLQQKDTKVYEMAKRISEDLDKSYTALFDGPLPAVSAENLDFSKADLTDVPSSGLPINVALTDNENKFIACQSIITDLACWTLVSVAGTEKLRAQVLNDNQGMLAVGLSYDGAAFHLDNAQATALRMRYGAIPFDIIAQIGGSLKTLLASNAAGGLTLGTLSFGTGLLINELGMKNDTYIRATNAAATKMHVIAGLDVNDLIQLGSNPTGATTGEGNISIPRADAVDLPVAGGTRNGILILDKTNNRLCYYVSGLRFKLALGTAF